MNQLATITRDGAVSAYAPGDGLRRVARSYAWHAVTIGDADLAKRLAKTLGAALPAALADCAQALTPTTPETVTMRLGPLLTLTAGVGMSDADRSEWIAAALDALKGIPADLLDRGIRAARPVADHPRFIVPLIMAEILPAWRRRLADRNVVRELMTLADDQAPGSANPADERLDPADVDQANALMRKFRLTSRYRADGSCFQLAAGEADPTLSPAATSPHNGTDPA